MHSPVHYLPRVRPARNRQPSRIENLNEKGGETVVATTQDVGLRIRKISIVTIIAVVSFAVVAGAVKGVDYNIPTGANGLIMVDKVGGFVRFFDPVTFQELR